MLDVLVMIICGLAIYTSFQFLYAQKRYPRTIQLYDIGPEINLELYTANKINWAGVFSKPKMVLVALEWKAPDSKNPYFTIKVTWEARPTEVLHVDYEAIEARILANFLEKKKGEDFQFYPNMKELN